MNTTQDALQASSNMEIIDLEKWERIDHYNFFQAIRSCQYGTTVQQDVTKLYNFRKEAKENGTNFRFSDIIYFFAIKACNQIDEFKTRIINGQPVIFDKIHPAFTYIPKGRNLHANVLCRYEDNYAQQTANIEYARKQTDLNPTLAPKGIENQNVIYFSIIKGVSFTSASNPWGDCNHDSTPRILFGQIIDHDNGKKMLPVSVEVLHSLADGKHLAEFYALFNEMCSAPEKYLK